MNCFTHALPHLDDAYTAVGCCLPDWLSAFDRKCRTREKHALEYVNVEDPIVATTARGVVQHHRDDEWFHQTPAFNELILKFSVELKELFGKERTMRPGLIGHIIVEMFLDAFLHQENPGKLEYFYQQVASVDNEQIQSAVNLFATRPTDKLVIAIERFKSERFLFDYETDAGVMYRINKVLGRVKLQPMPDDVLAWMPDARTRVYDRIDELLPNYPIKI